MAKLQDTLYAKYIAEREGLDILENESCFIIYKIRGRECFLADMYVDPKDRGSKQFPSMIQKLSDIAKEHGCEVITANVHAWDKGAAHSLSSSFKLGFKVAAANNGAVLIVKELSQGG